MKRHRTARLADELMNEHIQMPGCPQLIVTRSTAYRILKGLGYSTNPKDRYASVDYMVFSKPAIDEPLSGDTFLNEVWDAIREDLATQTAPSCLPIRKE